MSSPQRNFWVIFLLLSHSLEAQQVTNLVLEGAGIRGIAYAGSIRYQAVIIDSFGQVITKKEMIEHYDLMVDGGFMGNFPITVFDSVASVDGVSKRIPNPGTIGLRIDSPEQIAYDSLGIGRCSGT